MVAAREIVLRALLEKWDELDEAEEVHLNVAANQRVIEAGVVRERGSWVA